MIKEQCGYGCASPPRFFEKKVSLKPTGTAVDGR